MRLYTLVLSSVTALASLCVAAGAAAQTAASSANHDTLQEFCVKCHNSEDWAGSLDFESVDLNQPGGHPEVWEKAITKLRGRLMPPAGQDQPAQADIDTLVSFLETSIDSSVQKSKVGYVPIQRLNRTEFTTAVKDLIGVDLDPNQVLPTEIEVEGFDNIAGALGVSPSFLEQYMSAARLAAKRAVGEPQPKMATVFYRGGGGGGGQAGPGQGQTTHRDGLPLGTRGGMSFTHVFPTDGEYRFNFIDGDSIDAGLYPRGMETSATMVFLVDGVEVFRKELGGPEHMALAERDGPPGRVELIKQISGVPVQVTAGKHTVTMTFIERTWALSNDAAGNGKVSGMPILRDGIEVEGPFQPAGLSMNESRQKIFVCQPKEAAEEQPCAEQIARELATQAFRRPVTEDDLKWLMPFYEAGRAETGGFDAGVTELVTAVLSSPDFLYRSIKSDPAAEEARPLSTLELASRLSFFLWSQGPDEELLQKASDGTLSDPVVMQDQVERMLADPRANALVENFALAWLNLDELDQIEPIDPTFNAQMRGNFEKEIRLFLASVLLDSSKSVMDLLNADYTFVNEALARLYAIPNVLGPQFRKVQLQDENRWGLLGKGAVLLRTSYGDRTSPVLRGAWVLDRIMGTPPTPPPPNVETDLSVREGEKPTTVRARLEAHRANPNCQGCHGLIDPPGLVLENFDVTGRWRDTDTVAREKIDATTTMTNGTVLHKPADLRAFLNSRPDQFPQTVTKKLMMYALNREVEYYDMPQIRVIVKAAEAQNYTFASLVTGIVNSDAFRRQGADETTAKEATSNAVAANSSAAQ